MAYTLQQLQAMGAKPVAPQPTAPVGGVSVPKKKYTLAELQQAGAKPVAPTAKTVEQQRAERIAAGLPVAVNKNKVAPTLGGNIIRGALGSAGSVLLSIPAGVRGEKGIRVRSNYIGETKDLASKMRDTADNLSARVNAGEISTGRAIAGVLGQAALNTADVASIIPVGGAAESAAVNTVKAVAGQTARQTLEQAAIASGKSFARGAGIGALYDVGGQAASGEKYNPVQTLKAAALGGAVDVGASQVLPAAITGAKNRYSAEARTARAVASREKELAKFDRYQSVKKITEDARGKGNDPVKMLSKTDVLAGAVDDTGNLKTLGEGGAHEQYTNKYLKPAEGVVRKNLEIEGNKISLAEVKKKMLNDIKNSSLEGEALTTALGKVEREIEGLASRADADGMIDVVKLHDAKVNKYDTIDYLNPASKKADKTIARTYKELVESNTKSVNVKKINSDLQKHYEVLNLLEKLDNKKVEGGKLGKYIAQGVGAVAGSTLPLGPFGPLLGAEVGARVKGAMMASKFSSKASQIIEQSPEMIQALQNIVDAEDLAVKKQYQNKLRAMLEAKNVKPAEMPSLYEAYTPESKLPVIDFGKPAKPKKSPLPTVSKDSLPDVIPGQRSRSISQKNITSPTKVKTKVAMPTSITSNKKNVNIPTKKVASPRGTGKIANLPKKNIFKAAVENLKDSKKRQAGFARIPGGNSIETGKPFKMTAYRGGNGTSPSGTFYSPDISVAKNYAKRKGGTVSQGSIELKNPLVIDANHADAIDSIIKKIKPSDTELAKKFEKIMAYVRGNRYVLMGKQKAGELFENDIIKFVDPVFKEYARKNGFDGIVRMDGKKVFEIVDLKKALLPKQK